MESGKLKKVTKSLLQSIQLSAKDESKFIMSDVAPPLVATWLTLLAVCNDTVPAMLMSVILPCVATLMGNTTVGLESSTNDEVS